ncbi:MAG: hypothetical protein ACX931_08135 [Saccharospirillum sp.]
MKSRLSILLSSTLLGPLAIADAHSIDLALGSSYQGNLNDQSERHWNNGAAFDRLNLCADETTGAGLYHFSSGIPVELSLFDAQQTLISTLSLDDADATTSVLLTPGLGQCRYLVVSAQAPEVQGQYALTAQNTTGDPAQMSTSRPYLASVDAWNQQPSLSVEATSRVELTLLDSSNSMDGRLVGDALTEPLEQCAAQALQSTALLDSGTYYVQLNRQAQASTDDEDWMYQDCLAGLVDSGDYFTLSYTSTALPGGLRNDGSVAVTDQVTGMLAGSENTYELSLTETTRLRIQLESDEFDTVLAVTGAGTDLENDDGGDGTNSALSPILEPGDYVVTVRSYSGNGQGLYDLTLTGEAFDSELSSGGPIASGDRVQGVLTADENLYTFTLTETSQVVVAMESEEFDTYLELTGADTDLSDDDGGDGTDSRISTLLPAGDYTISAGSYSGNGSYLLSLDATGFDPAADSEATLTPGERVSGTLLGRDSLVYNLVIETAGDYRIDVRSSDVDAFLSLTGESIREENDDGGEGTDACLTLTLAPGQYQLIASAYFGSTDGELETEVAALRGRDARGC